MLNYVYCNSKTHKCNSRIILNKTKRFGKHTRDWVVTCRNCNTMQQMTICNVCEGTKELNNSYCPNCLGTGLYTTEYPKEYFISIGAVKNE